MIEPSASIIIDTFLYIGWTTIEYPCTSEALRSGELVDINRSTSSTNQPLS